MSLEQMLTGLTEALNKNTETALALIAQLKVTGENQERLIAGQAAAIDKVEAPKQTRSRKPKDETPPAAEATPEPETVPARTISDDDLRTTATAFLGMDKDPAAVTARKGFVAEVMKHLGTAKLCGPESTLDDDGRKQAWFYIKRKGEGLKVDLSADYDFDGDVTAGGEPDAADDGDDLGI